MKIEYRTFTPEIRAEGDEYVFEGYPATWDTVDSYGTMFKRGAFKKTISDRGSRIKVLWNHNVNEPIGKIVEIKEDAKGLFVRGLLTRGVAKADDVFKNLKAGVIDTLSFGFTPILDKKVDGARSFTEVKLYEVSPVTFEANEGAKVIEVRNDEENSTDTNTPDDDNGGMPKAERADDFDETLETFKLSNEGSFLIEALYQTIWDIWWSDDQETVISKLDMAISDFHAAYLRWAKEFTDKFWETRTLAMAKNDLSKAFITETRKSLESISLETSFTVKELQALSRGKILPKESRQKLAELPESIRSAHQQERSRAVETLCDELREGGFSNAEKVRISALLGL